MAWAPERRIPEPAESIDSDLPGEKRGLVLRSKDGMLGDRRASPQTGHDDPEIEAFRYRERKRDDERGWRGYYGSG